MIARLSTPLIGLLLLTACSSKKQIDIYEIPKSKEEKTEQKIILETTEDKDLSWQGYYFGILPCEDCNGIRTWLKLGGTKKNTTYELMQNYDGITGKDIDVKNNAKWSETDSILYLQDKMVFVGEKFVTFIKDSSQMLQNEYTLEKLDEFNDNETDFLVSPKSFQGGTIGGAKAWRFEAIKNYKKQANNVKSSSLAYIINCKTKQFAQVQKSDFSEYFVNGNMLSSEDTKSKYQIAQSGSLMRAVLDKYCENK